VDSKSLTIGRTYLGKNGWEIGVIFGIGLGVGFRTFWD